MNGTNPADRAGVHLLLRMDDRRHEVAVPHQELHARSFNRLHEPNCVASAGGDRLVLHDMLARECRSNAQVAVPGRLGADDRDIDVELAQGSLDVADIGNMVGFGKVLVALVRSVGNLRIVSDHRQLEARMRCHAARHVVVLDGTQDGTAKDARLVHFNTSKGSAKNKEIAWFVRSDVATASLTITTCRSVG